MFVCRCNNYFYFLHIRISISNVICGRFYLIIIPMIPFVFKSKIWPYILKHRSHVRSFLPSSKHALMLSCSLIGLLESSLSTGVIIISSFLTFGLSAILFAGWSPGTCKMNILGLFNWFVFKHQHKQYFSYTVANICWKISIFSLAS